MGHWLGLLMTNAENTMMAVCRLLAACVNQQHLPADIDRAMWLLLLELEGQRKGCL